MLLLGQEGRDRELRVTFSTMEGKDNLTRTPGEGRTEAETLSGLEEEERNWRERGWTTLSRRVAVSSWRRKWGTECFFFSFSFLR